MDLSKAKILVTGGGRGIGNYIVMGLLESVEKMIVIEQNPDLLANLPKHENLLGFKCDITHPFEVEKLIEEIFQNYGGINVCINNAGIIHNEPIVNLLSAGDHKHSIENWEKVINLNLNAVFYISSNVIEKMLLNRQKGVVINISSISARGNVGQSAYSATKAAVEVLSKTWSKELGMFKIRCVSIAPGFFDTPSTRESLSDSMLVKWQKSIPLGRLGELEELLSAVRFVIENEYFNGKTLDLDGGLNL
jgi:3-oxoacyl-[acyl-carrier protein] reductase